MFLFSIVFVHRNTRSIGELVECGPWVGHSSVSLSQRLDPQIKLLDRFLLSFCNTDEVFAVAISEKGAIGRGFFYGLITLPYFGWALGTLLGAAAGTFLPAIVRSALGIAIYGMFLAIVIPPAKRSKPILTAVILSALLSCLFRFLPLLQNVSKGFVIIICAVGVSALCAKLFPLQEDDL